MSPQTAEGLARLVGFTFEDHEAKGLRKFSAVAEAQRPVHFSLAEMVSLRPAVLLHAPHGGGKTRAAQALADALLAYDAGGADLLHAALPRNPEGDLHPQAWTAGAMHPLLWQETDGLTGAEALVETASVRDAPILMIFDGLPEGFGPGLQRALDLTQADGSGCGHRMVVFLDSGKMDLLVRPSALPAYRLMPLPRSERGRRRPEDPVTADWMEPGLWALSCAAGRALDLQEAAGLAPAIPASPQEESWLQDARRARAWTTQAAPVILQQITANPLGATAALGLLAEWWGPHHPQAAVLATGLLNSTADVTHILAAEALVRPGSAESDLMARSLLLRLAATDTFPLRRKIGETLSRLGDPRDLCQLCEIPAGSYPMGSTAHPNSAPPHSVTLAPFRIARHTVTVTDYARFIAATGRLWRSTARDDPSRRNNPATDLTWYDACAYCLWLTTVWRDEGRIAVDEVVRLPTEREWESAARGAQGYFWPWGNDWQPLHSNGEESGFNDICASGLFPEGRSAFGCEDMAGNIWEWCHTLWGEDMAHPSFPFPWQDDGREADEAAPTMRRVLRGGCFSSPDWKANGIYRGSLEPAGFWRGNGFRVVVARHAAKP